MTCDCKGCTERRILCHNSCEKYAAFKEEVANFNKNKKEYEDSLYSLYAKKVYGWRKQNGRYYSNWY